MDFERYTPEAPPETGDTAQIVRYVHSELQRFAAFVSILADGYMEETTVAPTKPRGGMVRLADGTLWNPGAGRGVYWYDAIVPGWVKL